MSIVFCKIIGDLLKLTLRWAGRSSLSLPAEVCPLQPHAAGVPKYRFWKRGTAVTSLFPSFYEGNGGDRCIRTR